MKKLRRFTALLLALCLVMGLAACASKDEGAPSGGNDQSAPAPSGTSDPAPSGGEPGGSGAAPADRSLMIGTTIAPASFLSSMGASNPFMSMVFDTLVMYNEAGELIPGLAAKWSYTDDYTLELKLREVERFTGGQDFVASDVLYSLNYWATETTMAESFSAYDLAACTAPDDHTVVLKFTEIYGPAISALTQFSMFSEDWAKNATGDDWFANPNGTGAYVCTENLDGQQTSFVRKDAADYWGELPECESVTYKYYAETSTMYIDLEQGALDLAYNIASVDAERLMNGTEDNKDLAYQLQGMRINMGLGLCEYCPYWEDIRVRQAVALSLDTSAIAQAALGVLWQPADSMLPGSVSYYYSVGQRQQDIEKARSLMAEAGYADGFEIRAIINLGSVDLATAVQACLAQIGITMNVESYDLGTQIPMWIAGETDITVDSGGESNATGDPFASTSFYYEGSTLTAARINDPEFNEYFYEGLYSVDPDVRAEAYRKMQEWNFENCRIIPICESTRCTAWNSAKISSVSFTNPGRPVVTYIHFA